MAVVSSSALHIFLQFSVNKFGKQVDGWLSHAHSYVLHK